MAPEPPADAPSDEKRSRHHRHSRKHRKKRLSKAALDKSLAASKKENSKLLHEMMDNSQRQTAALLDKLMKDISPGAKASDSERVAHEMTLNYERVRAEKELIERQLHTAQVELSQARAKALEAPRSNTGMVPATPAVSGRRMPVSVPPTPAVDQVGMTPMSKTIATSYAHPKSPSAKLLHEQTIASLKLPPEEWADELAGINGQLIESLEELAQRDDELAAMTEELNVCRESMKDMQAQQILLYREHLATEATFRAEIKELQTELDEANAEKKRAAVKAARLDQLVAVLEAEDGEGDPNAKMRDAVRELTRKIAAYEVNQNELSRRYTLLEESEKKQRTSFDELRHDHVAMVRHLKLRILYLELWRRGAQACIEEQQRMADEMVPRRGAERTARELSSTKKKYKELLVREAELRAARDVERDLPRQVQEAKLRLEDALIRERRRTCFSNRRLPSARGLSSSSIRETHVGAAVAQTPSWHIMISSWPLWRNTRERQRGYSS